MSVSPMPRPKVKITYPKEGAEETYSDRHEPRNRSFHTSKHIAGRDTRATVGFLAS